MTTRTAWPRQRKGSGVAYQIKAKDKGKWKDKEREGKIAVDKRWLTEITTWRRRQEYEVKPEVLAETTCLEEEANDSLERWVTVEDGG